MLCCGPVGVHAQNGDLSLQCMQDLAVNLTRCYEAIPGFPVNPLFRLNSVRLLFLCSQNGTAADVLQVLSQDTYYSSLIQNESVLMRADGLYTNFTRLPLTAWLPDAQENAAAVQARGDGYTGHQAWLLNPQIAGGMVDLGILQDLSLLVSSDRNLHWPDIHPWYRTVSANYGGKVLMVPMDGAMWMMYARKDVLAAAGLPVPVTWEELIDTAAAVNGTDMNGDGVPDTAFCFPACLGAFMIQAIWASIVQTHGMQQGFYYDSITMQAMANTSGFELALQLYTRMYPYTIPLQTTVFNWRAALTCLNYEPAFSDGKCAFTFGWNYQFKRNSHAGSCRQGAFYEASTNCTGANMPRYVRGKVTTAPLPGSTVVYVRDTATLETCTTDLCPYATAVTANGTTSLVNMVPYTTSGGVGGAVNLQASTPYQLFAYSFVTFHAYPLVSTIALLNPLTEMGPFRSSQLDEDLMLATYGTNWVSSGYEASDTASMLATVNAALAHPNIAMDCRLANSIWYSSIVTHAGYSMSSGYQSQASVMAELSSSLGRLVPNTTAALAQLRESYWVSLNFALPPPPSPSMDSPPGLGRGRGHPSSFLSHAGLAGPVLACSALAALLLLLAVLLVSRQRHSHKSLMGRVLAPKAGPATTLLVTDIESSTTLWEVFEDAQIMDAALRLHHTIIRSLLIKHSGYETATEGDSFIVAFHTATKALQFSLDTQVALLHAPWPAALDAALASRCVWAATPCALALDDRSDFDSSSCGGSRCSALTGTGTVRADLALKYPVTENARPWSLGKPGTAAAGLIQRGLRVRIGLHSGVTSEGDVNVNATSGRFTYSGEGMVMAKAVADAAHGGQILCTETCYAFLWGATSAGQGPPSKFQCMCWHAGMHVLKEGLPPLQLYTVLPRALIHRVALFPPLRSFARRLPGVLDAPLGTLAVSMLSFTGAAALLEWDPEEAAHAVSVFQACCAAVAEEQGGYASEHGVGEVLGAFSTCSAAVVWSLRVIDAMKQHPWSDVLLSHPLCEDLSISGFQVPATKLVKAPTKRKLTPPSSAGFLKPPHHAQKGGGHPEDKATSALSHQLRPPREVCCTLNSGYSAVFDAGGLASLRSVRSSLDYTFLHTLAGGGSEATGSAEVSRRLSNVGCSVGLTHSQSQVSGLLTSMTSGPLRGMSHTFTAHQMWGHEVSGLSASPSCSQVGVGDTSPRLAGQAGQAATSPLLTVGYDAQAGVSAFQALSSQLLEDVGEQPPSPLRMYASARPPLSPPPPQQLQQQQQQPAAPAMPPQTAVLAFRGPRVKAGVAVGELKADVLGTVGRLAYRGRAVTLAARFLEAAQSSQVVCSARVAEGVCVDADGSRSSVSLRQDAVTCVPTGRIVKVAQEKTELHLCRFWCSADDWVCPRPPGGRGGSTLTTAASGTSSGGAGDTPTTPGPTSCPATNSRFASLKSIVVPRSGVRSHNRLTGASGPLTCGAATPLGGGTPSSRLNMAAIAAPGGAGVPADLVAAGLLELRDVLSPQNSMLAGSSFKARRSST